MDQIAFGVTAVDGYRYRHDGTFHRLVDGIRAVLRSDIISQADIIQALALAVHLNQEEDIRARVDAAQPQGTP